MSVPSWLKVTAVTGSEWAGNVFSVLAGQMSACDREKDEGSTSCDVPYANSLIEPSRHQQVGRGAKVDAKYKIGVSSQNLDHGQLSRGQVLEFSGTGESTTNLLNAPNIYCLVVRRGREKLSVKRPCDVRHALGVAFECFYELSMLNIPHLDELVSSFFA